MPLPSSLTWALYWFIILLADKHKISPPILYTLTSWQHGNFNELVLQENTVVCTLKVGIFHTSRRFETHQFKILMVPLVLTNLHHHCRQWEATEAYEIKVTLLEFKVLPWRSWHYKDIHKEISDFSVVQC